MVTHPHRYDLATISQALAPGPTFESVTDRLGFVLVSLAYGAVIALIAVLTALAVVTFTALLPDTLPFTLLLWAMALVGVAASPNLARWLLRQLLKPRTD